MNATSAAIEGYNILARVFLVIDGTRLPHLLPTISNTLGSFVLPLLYGALGACAFLLRGAVQQLHNRSFLATRSGDYGVRFYLGTISGVTLQWVFVGDGKQIPGGFTPAVLAFAGGYSVDVIFAVFDRVINTVTNAIRTAAPSGTAPSMPDTSREPAPKYLDASATPSAERRAPTRPFQPPTPDPAVEATTGTDEGKRELEVPPVAAGERRR